MAKKKDNALATNRKARREYHILETVEAGLVLTGTEIKSIRAGRLNIGDGFVGFRNGEAFLYNVHISPWKQGNRYNVDPTRTRKLLLHKKQIRTWSQEVKNKGTTIVPLKVYIKNGYAKVLLGLAQGKQLHDKREDMKRRDQKREMDRALKEHY